MAATAGLPVAERAEAQARTLGQRFYFSYVMTGLPQILLRVWSLLH